jgi:HCOMODA/2-hydroxy-3-carboxy-muconic semialdehyde decarboxylase
VLPFTVSRSRLRPVCHMGGFLGREAPLFEIRDHAGSGSDMLIRDLALGRHLAASLGGAAVVLMRGHGITVCGADLPQAVFRSVYAQKNAEIQLAAMALGEVTFLTPEEARAADEANSGQVARAWDCWEAECRPGGPSPPAGSGR